eukprot:3275158-Rhodomonas_salina.1
MQLSSYAVSGTEVGYAATAVSSTAVRPAGTVLRAAVLRAGRLVPGAKKALTVIGTELIQVSQLHGELRQH